MQRFDEYARLGNLRVDAHGEDGVCYRRHRQRPHLHCGSRLLRCVRHPLASLVYIVPSWKRRVTGPWSEASFSRDNGRLSLRFRKQADQWKQRFLEVGRDNREVDNVAFSKSEVCSIQHFHTINNSANWYIYIVSADKT